MATVKKIVLIEFTPDQMFDLVDHVEDYPSFLPWCGGTELLARTDSITAATIHIAYHGLKTHFSTENDKIRPQHMKIRLTEGPFTRLDGTWDFTPLGGAACKVEFSLHYEFSSRIVEKVVGPVFNHIANTFVDAFVKRASQIYAVA
ncbi:MAG: type II toxin-antitoxin system RatA family toxin [Zoogloea sp.]|nr:type II toxin-antitoxin system RatA family toxin [Zoogloea sp.]